MKSLDHDFRPEELRIIYLVKNAYQNNIIDIAKEIHKFLESISMNNTLYRIKIKFLFSNVTHAYFFQHLQHTKCPTLYKYGTFENYGNYIVKMSNKNIEIFFVMNDFTFKNGRTGFIWKKVFKRTFVPEEKCSEDFGIDYPEGVMIKYHIEEIAGYNGFIFLELFYYHFHQEIFDNMYKNSKVKVYCLQREDIEAINMRRTEFYWNSIYIDNLMLNGYILYNTTYNELKGICKDIHIERYQEWDKL